MSAENFNKCMLRILAYEGGYSNHPKDPGGVTLEGVIQRVYDGYRDRKQIPRRDLTADIRGTPLWISERNEIYRNQYWDKVQGDDLPAGVDLVVFDGAVNSGPVQSIKWLQRALGVPNVDGNLGEATMAALEARVDYEKLIADICSRRLAFLQQLKTWSTFGPGWSKRVTNVKTVAQAMVRGTTPPSAKPIVEESGKASVNDLSEAPVSVGVGTVSTTAGTVTSGVLDPLQTATASLTPFSDGIQIVKYIVIALTVLVAGVTLYGVYRTYKVNRARAGEDVVTVPEGEF